MRTGSRPIASNILSTSLYMWPAHPHLDPPSCSAAMETPTFCSNTGTSDSCTLNTGPSNPNPFYPKFITGNIRICQGCRQSLRTSSGAIPDPPYNLVVARSEKRPYRDSPGELVLLECSLATMLQSAVFCKLSRHSTPVFKKFPQILVVN